MLWQILHRALGWDYAHLRNCASEIVRRIHLTASGERFVHYFEDHIVFIDRPDCGWEVTDLTMWRPVVVASDVPLSPEALERFRGAFARAHPSKTLHGRVL